MTLTIIILYLCLVVVIGSLSHRLFRGTGEDYFVASRSIGPFLLLMSLFGTNMTAFAILGASGEAYQSFPGAFPGLERRFGNPVDERWKRDHPSELWVICPHC